MSCRKAILSLLCCSIQIGLQGQNLVPNPSFENTRATPCDINEFFVQDVLTEWLQPIPTTTDYWRNDIDLSCDLNPNRLNIQPHTDRAMIAIITALLFQDITDEYKEYIEVKLNRPLTRKKIYCGEFYAINRNIAGDILNPDTDILESNNLSMAFVDTLIDYPRISNDPRIELNYPSWVQISQLSIIPADNQWHRISGCFVAEKAYQYLLIGNFQSIDSTLINRKTFGKEFATAYYFIDDVSLFELPYKTPDLADTISFCHDEKQIILDATSDGATGYTWQDDSTDPQLVVTTKQSEAYKVDISYGNFVYRHTFYVQYIPDIELGSDTLLCEGESIVLGPNHPIKEYLWFDQTSDSIKVISKAGIYWVEVKSECIVRDSIEINFIDCPGFIPNVFTPNGDGYNPVFDIENIENRRWGLQVFNRWGKEVYENEHYQNDWAGEGLTPGVYYYLLYSKALNKEIKGWVQIIY